MSQMKSNLEHLKNHVPYPTDKAGVVSACNNMMDVPEEDRTWFESALPEGKYENAEGVIKAVLENI